MIECLVTTGTCTFSNAVRMDREPMRFESRPMVGEHILCGTIRFKVVAVTHIPGQHGKIALLVEQSGIGHVFC